MIEAAMKYILSLKRPEIVDVDGRNYSTLQLTPVKEPMIPMISVQTLTGLVDYIQNNKDGVDTESMMIHVVSPTKVELLTSVTGDFRERELLIVASAERAPFKYDAFQALEQFIVGLHSCFLPDDNRDALLKLVSSVTEEANVTYGDDGVSQAVQTRQGVALRATTPVPNPVELAPYRSFCEVAPVPSRFVFRLRSAQKDRNVEPGAALFEADGGAWKLENIQRIKAYLETKLPNIAILA